MIGRRTYLFVLCPAFSGSTVLYRLLGSSPNASTLFGHGNWAGEGQFVPAVQPVMRRQANPDPRVDGWEDPAVEMPWGRIRLEWERCWDLTKPVLVEKSPPNVLRAPAIEKHFSQFGDVYFVAMIRSPYHVRQRPEVWLEEARHQRRNIRTLKNLFWTTYERLCADVEGTARCLTEFLPILGHLDPATGPGMSGEEVAGRSGRITDRNRTTRSLVLHRNRELEAHEELLHFFGYDLLKPGSADWAREPWLPEITVERTYPAPPETLFRAWLETPLLEKWWGRARTEPRVGGEYSFAPYPGAADRIPPIAGRYLELEAGRRLRFTWRMQPADYLLDDSTVEVRFEEAAGRRTALELRSLAVSRSWYASNRAFWETKLEHLGSLFSD